jgi:hypothetical protein
VHPSIIVFNRPLDCALVVGCYCSSYATDAHVHFGRLSNVVVKGVGDAPGGAIVNSNEERVGVIAMILNRCRQFHEWKKLAASF